uniref:HYDIN/VesB/CFA65-like Ig-like domain-containing protein n=1 Tax=Dendroctonus ponderosae TaxID=77166 RepID=A0AAR5PJX4_DENPD
MLKRAVKISEDSESLGSCTDRSKSQDNVSISTVQLISQHNIYKEVIESHMPIADITSFEAVEPVEKDRFISDRFSYFKKNLQDMASIRELEKPLFINGVRIQPGCMIFKDAYDGKSFNQTITITNRGKFIVNIRISPPTSKAFKIKPILIPHVLSPGLSIVKRIQYLYTKPTAIPQACMDIFVNNDCLRYELLVNTCFTQVSVWPRVIDFGEIDVCMVSEVKKITITNSGTKQATYSTDLGRNPLQIIVKPMKGTVQPGESKQIAVEVFGTCEGEFNQEFWIKTEPLQRVHIQGHFIEPGLKVDYPLANRNILVLTFPKTFVGVQQDRNVVIKNYSSTSTVFCVIGITRDDEHLPFNDLSGKDINFKQFAIHPVEGRLHKDQKYIMTIT